MRTIINHSPKEVSFPVDQPNSKINQCFSKFGCLPNSKGFEAICNGEKVKLMFTEPVINDTNVTIYCAKTRYWTMNVSIHVKDQYTTNLICLWIIVSMAISIIICLILYVVGCYRINCFATDRTKIITFPWKPKRIDFEEELRKIERNNMIVIRTASESEEEDFDSENENLVLLKHHFESDLKQVLKPWNDVKLGQKLGNGNYGMVYHGVLNVGSFTKVEVAVKEAIRLEEKTDFIHEAKTMARVKRNDYIVNLQGISYAGQHIYLLLEFCTNGDVASYLKTYPEFKARARENDYSFPIQCCSQVASGMVFLSNNGVKHVSTHFTKK